MNVTVLVDFDNTSATTAVAVADALGGDLWGVRLDTSERLVDAGLAGRDGRSAPDRGERAAGTGGARRAGRRRRTGRVRIVASGGFDAERIREFEAADAPVDAYGVGSSLLRGQNDFTADVVQLDGRPVAKVGREYRPNPRLERVG